MGQSIRDPETGTPLFEFVGVPSPNEAMKELAKAAVAFAAAVQKYEDHLAAEPCPDERRKMASASEKLLRDVCIAGGIGPSLIDT